MTQAAKSVNIVSILVVILTLLFKAKAISNRIVGNARVLGYEDIVEVQKGVI